MGTKRRLGIVLFLYVIIMALLSISPGMLASSSASDCEIVTKVFRLTGAKPTGLQVNGWANIDEANIVQGSAAFLQGRLQKLGGHGFKYTVTNSCDGQSQVVEAQGGIEPDICFRVVLKSPYLAASVISANTSRSLEELTKYLLMLIPEQDLRRSVIISGSLPGQTSPRRANEIVRRIAVLTHVQNVETLVTGGLVSITGYTPDVRHRLTSDEKSVNINIAFRYNSVEHRTFLYVGSPTITNEY